MARCSNGLLGLLNAGVLVLALAVLGGGIWLSHRAATTDCERFLERPVIALGALLLALSLAGLAGSLCGASCLLWLYLVALFILIALLLVFTAFAFVVTNRGAGSVVSGRGYKEYRLGEYSTWLQRRVEDSENWARIRSCLRDGSVCQRFGARGESLQQFVTNNLSPIQVDFFFALAFIQSSQFCCSCATAATWNLGANRLVSGGCEIASPLNNLSISYLISMLRYYIAD
ncbi:senescence-associated protein DH [Hordeum vulgare]|nr:senescence-associated protein DH [Hordeum vulgare]